jgi:hypothetical protein
MPEGSRPHDQGTARAGDESVTLQIDKRVENLTFLQPDGNALALAAFAGRPLLLIFLRHLA